MRASDSSRTNVSLKQARWCAQMWVLFSVLAAILAPGRVFAQAIEQSQATSALPWRDYDRLQITALAGMSQALLLGGGNVQVDLAYKRFVFDYSHGFALDFEGSSVTGDASDQGLAFRMPYTTGFGIGVRLLEWLDVRAEGKLHRFEVREEAPDIERFSYHTMTAGMGLYARYRPFFHFGASASTPEWTHGFVIAPSVRYWPNVWSSLDDDAITYDNQTTGQRETHDALRAGLANTPFVANIALGYMTTF